MFFPLSLMRTETAPSPIAARRGRPIVTTIDFNVGSFANSEANALLSWLRPDFVASSWLSSANSPDASSAFASTNRRFSTCSRRDLPTRAPRRVKTRSYSATASVSLYPWAEILAPVGRSDRASAIEARSGESTGRDGFVAAAAPSANTATATDSASRATSGRRVIDGVWTSPEARQARACSACRISVATCGIAARIGIASTGHSTW